MKDFNEVIFFILENNAMIKSKVLDEPLFSKQAKSNILIYLSEKMFLISYSFLPKKFEEFIIQEQGSNEISFLDRKKIKEHSLFKSFENKLKQGYWEELVQQYPLLQKFIKNVIEQSVKNLEQFKDHLFQDASILYSSYGINVTHKKDLITNLTFTKSSREYQQCSYIVELDNQKILYKPSRAKTYAAWTAFQNWLKIHKSPFLPLIPFTLEKESYAWQEFVTELHLTKKSSIRKFLYENGCLLAIAFLLGTVDLHERNVFSTSKGLAFIDGECMFSPIIHRKYPQKKTALICGIIYKISPYMNHSLQFIEKKEISRKNEWIYSHKKELIKGFKTMYRFFLKKKESFLNDLIDDEGSLIDFQKAKIRFMMNFSKNYFNVFFNSSQELEREKNFEEEIAKIAFCDACKIPEILEFEKFHLRQFSFPTFYTNCTSRTYSLPGENTAHKLFSKSCLEQLISNTKDLSLKELEKETKNIKNVINKNFLPKTTKKLL